MSILVAESNPFLQFFADHTMLVVEVLIAVFTAVVAIATWQAARAARKSSEAAERANQAQLFSELFDHYTDPNTARYVRRIVRWHKTHGENAPSRWLEALGNEQDPLHQEADGVEKARRVLHAFFAKAIELVKTSFLAEKLFKRLILDRMAEVFIKGVFPLSSALHPGREDVWQVQEYQRRYHIDRDEPFGWAHDPTTSPKGPTPKAQQSAEPGTS
jgi:hypothetical protein